MHMHSSGWHVALDLENADAYALLQQDRIWNCFAIADLVPPFREYSRYASALGLLGDGTPPDNNPAAASHAACLLLQHPQFAAISPYGAEAGAAEILAHLYARQELPGHAFLQSQDMYLSVFERSYRPAAHWRSLLRRAVSAASLVLPTDSGRRADVVGLAAIERLTPADAAELVELYNLFPESTFRPDQLEHGVFFGLRVESKLVAVGGTHAIAPSFGIAVVGGIFTHPEVRGRGYARAVTGTPVTELFNLGCRDVVLTVVYGNDPATRVYERRGFQTHCGFWSVAGARRPGPTAHNLAHRQQA